jgi:phage replication O-like protein O
MSDTTNKSPFRGYGDPHYTQIPDVLFDEQLPDLSGAELKVLLYIMRRTYGFKKDSDNISLSQIMKGIMTRDGRVLDRGTGLSKDSVTKAVKSLEQLGFIHRQRRSSATHGDESTCYTLNRGPVSENRTPSPLSENQTRGSQKIGHAPVRKSDTQETVDQETVIQQTDLISTSNVANDTENVDNSNKKSRGQSGRRPNDLQSSKSSATIAVSTNRARSQTIDDPTGEGGPSGSVIAGHHGAGAIDDSRSSAQALAAARRLTGPNSDHLRGAGPAASRSRTTAPIGDLVRQRYEQFAPTAEGSAAGAPRPRRGIRRPDRVSPPAESRPGAITAPFDRRPRPLPTPYIKSVIADFSVQLHDDEHSRANVTRAMRLFQACGLDEETFVGKLYEARSITRVQSNVKKRAANGLGTINRMPYFFAVVEDLLGLNEERRDDRRMPRLGR